MAAADRIVLTHTGDDAVVEELRRRSYVQYLRRSKAGPAAVGDEWTEVVPDGCGETTQITLRVRAIDGPRRIGPATEFEDEARAD